MGGSIILDVGATDDGLMVTPACVHVREISCEIDKPRTYGLSSGVEEKERWERRPWFLVH